MPPTLQTRDSHLIDSDAEMQRLDRQAQLYGSADDLAHLALRGDEAVLDAGCGSGEISRSIAAALPRGQLTGVDREPRYVDYARRRAADSGAGNQRFVEGNLLALPFADHSFDLVWSKHVLQWVDRPDAALAELRRVTRPGGRVVVANFDGFLLQHFPQDAQVQDDLQRWFDAARTTMGFDNWLGRKLPSLFLGAGLVDLRIDTLPDKVFSGLGGGDDERLWNMRMQWDAAHAFSARVFGSDDAARAAGQRILARFADPTVYFHCTLFYVQGRVPDAG